jgi:3-methyladenine DNA glycosylase AlkC
MPSIIGRLRAAGLAARCKPHGGRRYDARRPASLSSELDPAADMTEPFKELLNKPLIDAVAQHLSRVHPAFKTKSFVAQAAAGLADLEMKDRAMQIATALQSHLPADFHAAAAVIEAALSPTQPGEALGTLRTGPLGLAGWVVWPLGEFVARQGLAHPVRALACLRELTQRFSAEFAIRAFIVEHPALVFKTLTTWVRDPSPHVRRLASEGSRPRLPWGLQLKTLIANPGPTLPLLRALQDDTSPYVRRSVANHLNDIAKDHPAVVAAWLEEHLPNASSERSALLRHASRSLIKAGDARVLKAWGLGHSFKGSASLSLQPARAQVGGELQLSLELQSTARQAQRLVVDYVVHHVKANGGSTPKVFKGWKLELAAGEHRVLEKKHSLALITTRRYHAGDHGITIQINGQPVAQAAFQLKL